MAGIKNTGHSKNSSSPDTTQSDSEVETPKPGDGDEGCSQLAEFDSKAPPNPSRCDKISERIRDRLTLAIEVRISSALTAARAMSNDWQAQNAKVLVYDIQTRTFSSITSWQASRHPTIVNKGEPAIIRKGTARLHITLNFTTGPVVVKEWMPGWALIGQLCGSLKKCFVVDGLKLELQNRDPLFDEKKRAGKRISKLALLDSTGFRRRSTRRREAHSWEDDNLVLDVPN